MLIERKSEPFRPITITLQNEEEANAFYHMLNCANATSILDYYKEKNIVFTNLIRFNLFDKLDDIYQPTDWKR